MKFSVIIPVYNVEKYISICIDSVLHQSYQNLELVLIDDGSTDRSGEICDQYAKFHADKVKVYHDTNKGPHSARMHGVDNASGDIVLFMDADDAIRTDALEQLHLRFKETECDMILFNASEDKNFEKARVQYPFNDGQCFCGESKKIVYEATILGNSMNSLVIKAVKHKLLADISQECRSFSGKNAEDLWLTLPLLTSAEKIVYLDQNLYYYRYNPESIVHSYNSMRHRSIKTVHLAMERYIDEWGMPEIHAKHYAREVRGWIDCLKMVLVSTKKTDIGLVRELAEDAYFLKAYAQMDHGMVSWKVALLARWLYEKKYGHIFIIGRLLRWRKIIQRVVKGNEET